MKVFVSHGSRDRWIAEQIAQNLHSVGAETWLDTYDILSGDDFEARIRDGIEHSDELLALITVVTTKRGWLLNEIGAAWGLRKRVSALLYGLTIDDLKKTEAGAGLLGERHVRDLNDASAYIEEVRRRCSHAE